MTDRQTHIQKDKQTYILIDRHTDTHPQRPAQSSVYQNILVSVLHSVSGVKLRNSVIQRETDTERHYHLEGSHKVGAKNERHL